MAPCDRAGLRMLVAALLAPATVLMAQVTAASAASEVQQLLKANCQQCHNAATRSSGLALTSRDALLSGGNRGPAIQPGNPAGSLLVRAVEQSGDLKMPPGRKLQPE